MENGQWSASLICTDLFTLQQDLVVLQEFQVEYLHIDIMDGSFVPRLGMYPEMVHKIKQVSDIPIEVHLMLQSPEQFIADFAQAGADVITIHLEACQPHLTRTLEMINNAGVQAGIALNPATELSGLEYINNMFEFLLIMGINPGILGQKIKPFIMDKISKYHRLFAESASQKKIIIDGGVNFDNYAQLFQAGADILVGGSQTIFHSSNSLSNNLIKLKKNKPSLVT